jgi:glyoxylase-like metal-dependent hydrolase (beta-lactamase superfamily II)
MKRAWSMMAAVAALLLTALPARAAEGPSGLERLYVLDCGWAHAVDQSRWSPGVNVGVPIDISGNCYLVKHKQGYLLWDTGISDRVAALPDGFSAGNGAMVWHRAKTLVAELAELGVKPDDIRYVAISHTHADHSGNIEEFPRSTLLMQGAEWEFGQKAQPPLFKADHPVMKLDGDKDVFGDGSVVILSTPGHTPGHQSLLVDLPKTGPVILSGDVVHFKSNWDNRRVPGFNADKEKSAASMQRVADVMAERHAQLWINHDKPQSDALKRAPDYYE